MVRTLFIAFLENNASARMQAIISDTCIKMMNLQELSAGTI